MNTIFGKLQKARLYAFSLFALLPGLSYAQPANDVCASSTLLTSASSPVPLTGQTMTAATATAGVPGSCGTATSVDVWYRFVAQSSYPTIILSSLGTGTPSITASGVRIQLLSGSCGTWTSLRCVTTTTMTTSGLAPLVVGQTYFIRIVTNTTSATGSNYGFDIAVVDAPANDECSAAPLLSSGSSCSPVSGTLEYAAITSGSPGGCGGTPQYDVWYRFVAEVTNPTITLGSVGTSVNSPRIQVFSGTCGALTSVACNLAPLTPTGLVVGATYYLRVFSVSGPIPTSNGGFTICITNPAPPANDDCLNATLLSSSGTACTALTGQTLLNATATAGVPSECGNSASADAWYRFVAQSNHPSITLAGIGSTFGTAGTRMQLLDGSCGTWTSLACVSGTGTSALTLNTATTPGGTGLVMGNTYYIRVYSNSPTMSGTNWGFSICVSNPVRPRYGNSYVNVSKKNIGGVVEQGDTLEVRMTIHYTSGTLYNTRYLDNVPTNTAMLSGAGDSIRVVTNEGLTYQRFTPLAGDDAATYVASPAPGEYNVRLNLGFQGSAPGPSVDNSLTDITGAGRMLGSNRPRGGSGLLFATSFRVVVTGAPGDIITLGAGKFMYRHAEDGPDSSLTATPYQILISEPMTLCANATGVNSAQESGGTFGSGTTLNRGYNLAYPIPGYTYVNNVSTAQAVGDGQYGIVKNSSPRSSTYRNARRAGNCTGPLPSQDSCINRMFNGHWYIDGDHTGTNDAIGNAPPAATDPGGYMLMVNADYVASEAYRQVVTGLCPNTFYEFSAWVRNICPNCGVDSIGSQTFRPGVNPNLTFILDDVDRYNTGEIDTTGWIKKGFVFQTGPSQTSLTFSIRNNGQGGGGNDWVMDDISIATCLPNMSYSPSLNPTVCEGNPLVLYDTIRSYFDNYTHHQWQESTDGGSSWTDLGAPRDSVSVFNPATNSYEYITRYTIPPTTVTDSGKLYRVLVATSATNLANPDCRVTDGISIINLAVQDCTPVLNTEWLSLNGRLVNGFGQLNWTTSKEEQGLQYIIERSTDGYIFTTAGTKQALVNGSEFNQYVFDDPVVLTGKTWYRIIMVTSTGRKKYSAVIQLQRQATDLQFVNVINPFKSSLSFDIAVPANAPVQLELVDMNGKTVLAGSRMAFAGVNHFSFDQTGHLAGGIYTLRVIAKDRMIVRRVLKH